MKYIAGNTVQGKRRTKSYKIHKVELAPKEEWVAVKNTHEAIIDKETFEKAKQVSLCDTRVCKNEDKLSIWAGLLKCSDCNRAMNKKSSTNKLGNKYEYYICSTYRKKSNKLCTKHSIKVENLENTVLAAINLNISKLVSFEKIIEKLKKEGLKNVQSQNIQNIIKLKQNEISKILNLKKYLYEDWKNGDITREEYLEYKQKYENDIKYLEENIQNLKLENEKYEEQNTIKNKWMENFIKQRKLRNLSRDIVLELVNAIYVHEDGSLTIKFNFTNKSVV